MNSYFQRIFESESYVEGIIKFKLKSMKKFHFVEYSVFNQQTNLVLCNHFGFDNLHGLSHLEILEENHDKNSFFIQDKNSPNLVV